MKNMTYILGCGVLTTICASASDSLAVRLPLGIALLGWVGFGLHQGWRWVTVEKAKAQELASRRRTAELEKELGFEPLNMHEVDDMLKDDK